MTSRTANRSVLVVEDEDDIRQALCELIAVEGYDARSVSDLTSARDELAREKVDAIVLDLMLGAESGADLLADLAERSDAPAVVVMSASPRAPIVASEYGVPLCRKPFDIDVLLHTLANAIAERRVPRRS